MSPLITCAGIVERAGGGSTTCARPAKIPIGGRWYCGRAHAPVVPRARATEASPQALSVMRQLAYYLAGCGAEGEQAALAWSQAMQRAADLGAPDLPAVLQMIAHEFLRVDRAGAARPIPAGDGDIFP